MWKIKIVPSINATDIIEVKKDEEVIITETINDWVCVQTKTTKGWIYKEKLKSKEDKKEESASKDDSSKQSVSDKPQKRKSSKR